MNTESKRGIIIGKPAPVFTLQDHSGSFVNLTGSIKVSSVILVFYPGDFTPVCTKQLCDYRDNMEQFHSFGVQLFGISKNDRDSHSKFVDAHKFPFPLLTDPDNKVAKQYGCSSLFMLGSISRAVFLVNTKGMILYRYIEPTVLTRRKSDDLIKVIKQLRDNKLF
jgi:thioredoxin-dependent peroxiredoxin